MKALILFTLLMTCCCKTVYSNSENDTLKYIIFLDDKQISVKEAIEKYEVKRVIQYRAGFCTNRDALKNLGEKYRNKCVIFYVTKKEENESAPQK